MLSTKSRARATAALATVVALVGSALAGQQVTSAAAAPSAAPATAPRATANLIQGVVVDQAGRAVDDVVVEAVGADGSTEATALTYASDREDGPQHGYFFVEVALGTYTLVLSKDGYRTVEYDAGQITQRRKRISMGVIEIQKVAAPTTTVAALERSSVTTKDNAAVAVTVSSKAAGRPVGDVEVREGRKVVGEATIRKNAKGKVTVTLDRLAPGDHELTAYFLGTADHRASRSKQLTQHVTKRKR